MRGLRFAVGADAYGFELKQAVVAWLKADGHVVTDVGIDGPQPDERLMDYADGVAGAVSRGEADRGVLLCMSGGMMNIRANRWRGVRAVMALNEAMVAHDREASDSNVLCVAAHATTLPELERMLVVFVRSAFNPLERRVKRLARLDEAVS